MMARMGNRLSTGSVPECRQSGCSLVENEEIVDPSGYTTKDLARHFGVSRQALSTLLNDAAPQDVTSSTTSLAGRSLRNSQSSGPRLGLRIDPADFSFGQFVARHSGKSPVRMGSWTKRRSFSSSAYRYWLCTDWSGRWVSYIDRLKRKCCMFIDPIAA